MFLHSTLHFFMYPIAIWYSWWCFEARSWPQIVELSSSNPEIDKVRWASETAIFISWSSIRLVTGGLTARSSQSWFLMCPLIMSFCILQVHMQLYYTWDKKILHLITKHVFTQPNQLLSFKPATAPRDLQFVGSVMYDISIDPKNEAINCTTPVNSWQSLV